MSTLSEEAKSSEVKWITMNCTRLSWLTDVYVVSSGGPARASGEEEEAGSEARDFHGGGALRPKRGSMGTSAATMKEGMVARQTQVKKLA